MPLHAYRGNHVSSDFLTALAHAFKDGAAVHGVNVTDPDNTILHAAEWAGVSTVTEAFELGKSFGAKQREEETHAEKT